MCLIIKGIDSLGRPYTAFQCKNLDPDDPERLARLYPQEPEDERPEVVEYNFRRLMFRDPQPRAKHVRLRDVADDGRVYL